MNCPNCGAKLKQIAVSVYGAKSKASSYQCPNGDYIEFEPASSEKVLEELRQHPLKIKQTIIKLSANRLGIYFNSNIIRSLNIKKGEEVYLSVPDKKHILIELG